MPKRQSSFVSSNIAVDAEFDQVEYDKVVAVHGNLTNINTVASIEEDIAIVADNGDAIALINTNIDNVEIVGDNIATVITVATDIDAIITTANDLNEAISEIETVANDLNEATSEIDTVANSIANVDIVGTSIDNVNTVGDNLSQVIYEGSTKNSFEVLAPLDTEITTVAGMSTEVESLYSDKATLDSLYADKSTLDSIYADKATLDSIVTDKAVLDSIYADKGTLDSLYADKTKLDTIHSDLTNIDTVATDIADVNSVATNIVPNLAEILLADDNATIATDKAAEAVISANEAAASADFIDDLFLGAKAADPTLDNDGDALQEGAMYYNTTLVPKQVKIWNGTIWNTAVFDSTGVVISFNGRDGAVTLSASDINTALGFTAVELTKVNVDALGVDSATVNSFTVETAVPVGAVFTDTVYDETDVVKAPAGVLPPLDGSNLTNIGGGLDAPIITQPINIYGGQEATYTITNYGSDLTYIVTGSDGTGSVTGDTITWTFTDSDPTRNEQLFIKATKEGYTDSPTTTETISVVYVPVVEDQDFVAVIDNYNILANVTNNSTDIEATAIDTTSIIEGYEANIVSSVDTFGDGSLIAKYELDGDANDTTGNYDGTATDVTYGTGKFGNAGVFNGVTSKLSTSVPTTASFTISMFVKAPSASTQSNNAGIFVFGGASDYTQVSIAENADNYTLLGSSSGTSWDLNVNLPDMTNEWMHLVITYDGTTIKVYYDFIEVLSTTVSLVYSGTFSMGKHYSLSDYADMSADQVEIYNRALTQAEVQTLYTQSVDNFTTTTPVIDGDIVNVDGTDMVADGVTGGATAITVGNIGTGITSTDLTITSVTSTSSNESNGYTSILDSSISFYVEVAIENVVAGGVHIGLSTSNTYQADVFGAVSSGYAYSSDGLKHNNSGGAGTAYGSTFSDGDILGVKLDRPSGELTFYKNGVSQGLAFTLLDTTILYLAIFTYTTDNSATFVIEQTNITYPIGGYSIPYLSNYTVPTTTVTAGATPTIAYINESRAIYDTITQDGAESDFVGMTSSAGAGENFEATFDYVDISNPASTGTTLNTSLYLEDGSKLVAVLDDDSINEVLVGVDVGSSVDNLDGTWNIDMSNITS